MCKELLTCQELSTLLKVRPSTVRRWTSSGIITAVRIGGISRYRLEDILEAKKPVEEEHKKKLIVRRRPEKNA